MCSVSEMGKSEIVNRIQPFIVDQGNEAIQQILQGTDFLNFLKKFSGENYGVSMAFAQSFDGQQARVGSLKFKVIEVFISEATSLPMAGEKWFKRKTIRIGDFSKFLKPQYSMVDWKHGIPSSWFKEDHHHVLNLIQRFITCEGHFSITHLYQMRFLTHIIGDDPLNLPFYLYNSLIKMSQRYQRQPLSFPQYVYHHGLINIIVQFQLNKKRKSWDEFLVVEGFRGMFSKKRIGRPSSRRRASSQEEEQRDQSSPRSQIDRSQPSSPPHCQHEVESVNVVQQPSSSRRFSRRSTHEDSLPPLEPLPTVQPFSEIYSRK